MTKPNNRSIAQKERWARIKAAQALDLVETQKKAMEIDDRPIMVKVGRHLVDPKDVAAIKGCGKRDLYVVVLKSQPNPEFPMWAKESEIAYLAGMYNILGADE